MVLSRATPPRVTRHKYCISGKIPHLLLTEIFFHVLSSFAIFFQNCRYRYWLKIYHSAGDRKSLMSRQLFIPMAQKWIPASMFLHPNPSKRTLLQSSKARTPCEKFRHALDLWGGGGRPSPIILGADIFVAFDPKFRVR
jgi:hypothetical protein